eukprot:CAMPEP_0181202640 /NCGR_PEP_ID=MMETSP1096-20121128/18958_1 /TAXON_ID=156174 ORGANISM="Chrysochromulina ericina, Strain CCMP281" /NCGR_SAMPLE_ID=MMETSP1096 /ASSEMBLY_ACC=CAM_ASM_000453 /LENGTH=75 /DNA_ID=CAMNT_0023293183 /DNA_START=127 /DNA_END=354 /DNA_ORIENTATION=+
MTASIASRAHPSHVRCHMTALCGWCRPSETRHSRDTPCLRPRARGLVFAGGARELAPVRWKRSAAPASSADAVQW